MPDLLFYLNGSNEIHRVTDLTLTDRPLHSNRDGAVLAAVAAFLLVSGLTVQWRLRRAILRQGQGKSGPEMIGEGYLCIKQHK